MGTLVATTFVTLDGVMQGPGGPNEDRAGGFEHGGWSAGYWSDDAMGAEIVAQQGRAESLLLGRTTWEIFAGHWPRVPDTDPIAKQLNSMPKYVVSDTLARAEWNNSTIVRGKDLKARVAELKRTSRETQVIGSVGLLQTLIREDLVDRYIVWIFPVVLGSGKRLFDGGAVPLGLRLASSRSFGSGVVVNDYVRDGDIRYGSFELE